MSVCGCEEALELLATREIDALLQGTNRGDLSVLPADWGGACGLPTAAVARRVKLFRQLTTPECDCFIQAIDAAVHGLKLNR